MPKPAPTMKEMRAFKIGARARKFALEDCAIEGYEVLLTAIAEARDTDPNSFPSCRRSWKSMNGVWRRSTQPKTPRSSS